MRKYTGMYILKPTLTEEQQDYFEYKIEYTEGGNIQVDDALDAGTSENITVLFKYKTIRIN